jgi:Family of unknown function (DUF5691)
VSTVRTGTEGPDGPDGWDELTVAALLGTDRRPVTDFSFLPDPLAVTAARLDGDPAGRLLDAAALTVAYRRGGARPATVEAAPETAPEDSLPRPGRAATARLGELLARVDLELLIFWCLTAARAGRVAPPECLPALLDLAARQPVLRPAVAGVLGERGRWLGARQAAWAKAVPVRADPIGADGPADASLWHFGSPSQRAAWLRRMRRTDPAAGSAALAQTWPGEPGQYRAAFLALLAEGLGPADEGLLETALDDRRQDVRAVAAEILSTLPSSGYAARMRGRAQRFVRRRGPDGPGGPQGLVVDVPDRLDPEAARDGITEVRPGARQSAEGRRQWWFEQVVAATGLGVWEQLFASPQAALAARLDEPWSQTLHAGWAAATVRQRDREWARALLATRARHRVAELLTLLSGDELAEAVRRRLAGLGPAEVQVLVTYLDGLPVPWPAAVSSDVLAWLRARMPALHPRPAQPLLNLMSYRLGVEGLPEVTRTAEDLPLDDPWRVALRSVARLIAVRARIHEELQ